MPTKSEALDSLKNPELQKAFEDSGQCFGTEFDADDETCTKQCSDTEACKLVFEAAEDPVESIQKESEEAPAPPLQESNTQESIKEETSMGNEEQKAPEVEPAATETGKKEVKKPAGFGDRTAAKDAYGFTESTKGSFIALQLATAPITKSDLIQVTNDKFGTDSSGRVNMVMYKMRDRGFAVKRAGKKYYLEGVTPQDLVDVVVKEAEAVEKDKIAATTKKKADAEEKKAVAAEKKADAAAAPDPAADKPAG